MRVHELRQILQEGQVNLYLDVSGSFVFDSELLIKKLLGVNDRYRESLPKNVYVFSTELYVVSLNSFLNQKYLSTYGTDITVVLKHLKKSKAKKALIYTDTCFGREDFELSSSKQVDLVVPYEVYHKEESLTKGVTSLKTLNWVNTVYKLEIDKKISLSIKGISLNKLRVNSTYQLIVPNPKGYPKEGYPRKKPVRVKLGSKFKYDWINKGCCYTFKEIGPKKYPRIDETNFYSDTYGKSWLVLKDKK